MKPKCRVNEGADLSETYRSVLVSLWRSGDVDRCIELMEEVKEHASSDVDAIGRMGKFVKIEHGDFDIGDDADDIMNSINSEYNKRHVKVEEESPNRNKDTMDVSSETPDSIGALRKVREAEYRSSAYLAKIHPKFHSIFKSETANLRERIKSHDGAIAKSMEENLKAMDEEYDRIVSKRRDKFETWARNHVLFTTVGTPNNPYTRSPPNLSYEEYEDYEEIYEGFEREGI